MNRCETHPTHLKRGANNYGWDPQTDRWDQCSLAPVARKSVAVVTLPEPERDPFLSVKDVAERLAVSKMTTYRLIASGQLRAVQVGRSYRVRQSALTEYLETAEVGGA